MVWKPGWEGLCSTALHKYFYIAVAKITLLKESYKIICLKTKLSAQGTVTLHVHKEACAALTVFFPSFW